MSFHRHLYLAAYDITSDSLRAAALRCVRAYATGGQKSVHEVWLTPAEKRDLLAEIKSCLDEADRFMLLRLDSRSRSYVLGRGEPPNDPDYFYVG
jgi:CRISPR-associated protein Cas2